MKIKINAIGSIRHIKKGKGKFLCLSLSVLLLVGIFLFLSKYVFFNAKQDNALMKAQDHEKETITISFVGDIMLSRGVQDVLLKESYDYPYVQVRALFLQDDLTVANLECPLTDRGNPVNKSAKFLFKAPIEHAKYLSENGFDCMNLCNNHSTDYRSAGLKDTIEALQDAGVGIVGAGMTGKDDMSFVFEKNGIRVGIIAFTPLPTEGFFYDETKPCISYAGEFSLDAVGEKIEELDADVKIVYFHFGVEFETRHSAEQEKYAHLAIDHGADLVVGAHPHVIQDQEEYKGKKIYYSLGNFVFDHQIPPKTDETMILQVEISKDGIVDTTEIYGKIVRAQVVLE